jgi:hypothetical protein
MSDRNVKIAQQVGMMRGLGDQLADQLVTIVKNAADEDRAGTWGLNGWIRTIHDLIDLSVRTSAAVLQGAVSGPFWAEQPDEPLPSEPITVPSTTYPRTLKAAGFERVGLPGVKLPDYCVGFQPPVLPAGKTDFRIVLRDYRFVGANYTGKVILTSLTDVGAKSDEMPVTVGL